MRSVIMLLQFQSTLPYGSETFFKRVSDIILISIHAPLRERPSVTMLLLSPLVFQSTLPYGSEAITFESARYVAISIHAPLRERLTNGYHHALAVEFQSTLPHGSDLHINKIILHSKHFNPRSLTGATRNSLLQCLA